MRGRLHKCLTCISLALLSYPAIGEEAEDAWDMRRSGTYNSGAPDAWRACSSTGVYTEEAPDRGYLPMLLQYAHQYRYVRDETGMKEKMYHSVDWDAKHSFDRFIKSKNWIHISPERFARREGRGETARYPWKDYGMQWIDSPSVDYREFEASGNNKGAVTFEQRFVDESDRKISLIARLSYDRWDRALGDLVGVNMYLTDTKGEMFNIAFYEVTSSYTCFEGDVSNRQTAWHASELRDNPIAGIPREYSNRPIQRTALYWGYLYKDGQDVNYAADKPQIYLFTINDLISYEPHQTDAAL